jgi:hypothetical protein
MPTWLVLVLGGFFSPGAHFTDSGTAGPGGGGRAAVGVSFALGQLELRPSISFALGDFSSNENPGGQSPVPLSGGMWATLVEMSAGYRGARLEPYATAGVGVGRMWSSDDWPRLGAAFRVAAGVDVAIARRLSVGVFGEIVALVANNDLSYWGAIGLEAKLRF